MKHFGWPQWIAVGMYAINLLTEANQDGKPKTGRHSLSKAILGTVIGAGLLYWGGFWG